MDLAEQTALTEALDRMWTRFLPEMRARVAILETAATAFAANTLTVAQQEAASAAAHKLAGVLGTFGLTRGTELARELELMYSRENGPDPAFGARLTATAAELGALLESRN
jgi:HPt (histidine-containing phosphotransfer) domain-containing protein